MARQANDGGAGVATLLGNQSALNKAVNAGKKAAPAATPWNTPQVGPSSAAALAAAAPKRATGSAPQASYASPQTYMGMSTPASTVATGAADSSSAVPAAPAVSQADYLAGDSTYQSALAALKKTMAGYQADHDSNEAKYDTDYNEGLKNLGWGGDAGWNQNDTNTAYGRSFQNQLNDFGSRDMLQSSYYGDALNQMARQFNQQKGDIDTARTNYRDDQDSTLNAENNQTQTAQQQALAEAIARMAAGVSAS